MTAPKKCWKRCCISALATLTATVFFLLGNLISDNPLPPTDPPYPLPRGLLPHDLQRNVTFVTTDDGGRLGNVISVLAVLYHCQVELGMTPLLPVRVHYTVCYYFRCNEGMPILERDFPKWEEKPWIHFSPENSKTFGPGIQFAYIGGHPTIVKLFPKHVKDLKEKFLTLRQPYLEYGRNQLDVARGSYLVSHNVSGNDSITYIGIHIRRGDYLDEVKNKPADESYFTRAMKVFRDSEKHPLFIIVSEDMEWAKKVVIPNNNDCLFLGHGSEASDVAFHPMEKGGRKIVRSHELGNDLSLLIHTNHSILTYGTFGMWAALLSEAKRVILPKEQEGEFINKRISEAHISGWTFM